jgi:hypothetical protein
MAMIIYSAGSAHAQLDPYRHFTRQPIDPNENGKIIYVPLASAFPGPRPADQPYDTAAASWYQELLGSRETKPDQVLDKGKYVLNRFETAGRDGARMLEVVVTRYPAPPAGAPLPQLRITEPSTNISASAVATATPVAGGMEFRFLVRPPLLGFAPNADSRNLPATERYTLSFLPARDVPLPARLRTAGTFSGAGVEARMAEGPPRLPVEERVAGKRLEFRSARSAPVVTYDERVAGRRQETRPKR